MKILLKGYKQIEAVRGKDQDHEVALKAGNTEKSGRNQGKSRLKEQKTMAFFEYLIFSHVNKHFHTTIIGRIVTIGYKAQRNVFGLNIRKIFLIKGVVKGRASLQEPSSPYLEVISKGIQNDLIR